MFLRTVLVVDDQPINRAILKKILAKDYRVLEAANGKEALDLMHQHKVKIAAVLLDLVMPVMDGYAFLEAKAVDSAITDIPVIVTTQQEGDETEIKALTLGANDFLRKPYNVQITIQRLANLIKLHEMVDFVSIIEYDSITGVYNKEAFTQQAAAAIEQNPAVSYDILSTDVARFKLINELFGEAEGNKLLRFIGDWLQKEVDAGHILLCGRNSADVFLILTLHDPAITQNFVQDLKEALDWYPLDIKIDIKIGCYPVDDVTTVEIMCDRAALAADSIKDKFGVHFSVYDDYLRLQLLREQNIVNNMQKALENDEFVVYYQPKYNLNTHEIVGAEALVRWLKPEEGLVPPSDFIPLFERNGFITTLDIYVWNKVCESIALWQKDLGPRMVPISVNVSRVDIYNPNLTDILLGLVKKHNIPVKLLHLEITESAYTEHPAQLIDVVNKLHSYGFTIEMDDFGKGYSSLNMLSELPIDILKMDMRFLTSRGSVGRQRNVLNFVVGLAKWLGLSVIAEGIETREQEVFLRNVSCELGQGYYYARPMIKSHFETELVKEACGLDVRPHEDVSYEGVIKSEDIWNPASQFNSLFNSYIGELLILEYSEQKLLFIRANKKFLQGLSKGDQDILRQIDDLLPYVVPECRQQLVELLNKAQKDNQEFERDVCWQGLWHATQRKCSHMQFKVLSNASGKTMFFVLTEDITEKLELAEEVERLRAQVAAGATVAPKP